MRKFVFVLLIAVLCITSCSAPVFNPFQFTSNPFLEKTWISEDKITEGDKISFSVTTDNHFDRENCEWYNENYYSFLDNRTTRYPFAISLGDLTDTGVFVDNALNFVDEVKNRTSEKFFTTCVGNHDRHSVDSRWDNGKDVEYETAGCYYYGTLEDGKTPLLAIYKLDNSYDCITNKEFEYLEEALKKEKARYRMIITHENVATGNTLGPTLVLFGLSSQETNRLYRIMSENNVGLILSGHNHIGNVEYHLSETLGELNMAAYHKKNNALLNMESPGYFYDFTLDTKTGDVVISGYLAKYTTSESTAVAEKTFNFKLPRSN